MELTFFRPLYRIRRVLLGMAAIAPILYVLVVIGGCGGSGGGVAAAVSISPSSPTVNPGQQQPFAATVSNAANTEVKWTVREGAAGGSISAAGVYTAPALAGTYHVVATSVADPTKSATAAVTVPIVVTVSPPTVNTTVGARTQFTAAVAGAANTGVQWSVQEGAAGGTITAAGEYTAPGVPGTYHVVAASQADPNRRAIATVHVGVGGAQIIVN